MNEARLVRNAAQRTLDGVEAAEVVGSGCAWFLVVGLPVSVGFLVALVWPWVGGAIGLLALLGAFGLHRLASVRTARARPLLEGMAQVHYPSLSLPVRIPRGEREKDGIRRVWRVLGVRRPNGRQVTGEVVVQHDMGGAWFVVWPVSRPRPAETRTLDMVLEPVLGGYLVSSPDPVATAEHLRDPLVRELLFELLGDHDELSIYPFIGWWRTRAAVDQGAMRGAEVRLTQLAQVLRGRTSPR